MSPRGLCPRVPGLLLRPGLQSPLSPALERRLHQDGTWSPGLCLGPWVWFRETVSSRALAPGPPHEVLSAKGSSRKEKRGLLSFKKYTWKYRKGERNHLLLHRKQ